MRTILVLMMAAVAGVAQERPVEALYRTPDGALRALVGVEGAWEARIVVGEGVVSAGSNGAWAFYKTESEIHVRRAGGEWVTAAAPAGRARAVYGEGLEFVFEDAGVRARWEDGLGELREGGEGGEDWIGAGLKMEERDGALWAVREGGEAVLLPMAEAVTFVVYHRDEDGEKAVGPTFTMPQAMVGESSVARFRVRNPGSAPVQISRLSIDVGAFRLFDQFFPPRFIEGGGFADFSVRFTPPSSGGYSSTLWVNDSKVILNGTTMAASTVEVELATGWKTLAAGDVVSLGTVERRAVLTRGLRVTPATAVTLTGTGYTLKATGEAGVSEIAVASDKAGVAAATLAVGTRKFTLQTTVTEFPAPRPTVELVGEAGTARQVKLKVKLDAAARAAVSGVLTLTFAPESGLPDDAAVAFLPQAVRSLALNFAEGASESGEYTLQTGTTAGELVVKAAVGGNAHEVAMRVLAEPVVLTAARAAASTAAAEVTLTGYDTTRSVAKVAFTFYLKSGAAAAPGRIEADVTQAFATYFKGVTGGTFALRANFPVSGTASELAGVDVEVANGKGVRQTSRLKFE